MKFDRSKIILFTIIILIVFGVGLAYIGYQNTIYPSEKALGYLSRAEASQSPQTMVKYLRMVSALLPTSGNPVWIFPNPSTDFSLIHDVTRRDGLACKPNYKCKHRYSRL